MFIEFCLYTRRTRTKIQKQSFPFSILDQNILFYSAGSESGDELSPHYPTEAEKKATTSAGNHPMIDVPNDSPSILAPSSTLVDLSESDSKLSIKLEIIRI